MLTLIGALAEPGLPTRFNEWLDGIMRSRAANIAGTVASSSKAGKTTVTNPVSVTISAARKILSSTFPKTVGKSHRNISQCHEQRQLFSVHLRCATWAPVDTVCTENMIYWHIFLEKKRPTVQTGGISVYSSSGVY
ncbi:hypothetical protein BABINDRAFT_139370 [Babjeviella inositovora NRRL Y-12698]|uniref:Uncharacterized protein n=1 Tax=Babjeviella inositovora NRRL Y-12698 TaxID=984486 RepID=A0A1E3QQV2_9ASCO|nr:uncharacterized protein BABINDRAFT_139370 [Babjeviella inositovora NRRL Y-12698]ODQ80065.1 hypothetical protein BABINDRAFT_139370 [Babjeviella inositovora NRRL Y-12698]